MEIKPKARVDMKNLEGCSNNGTLIPSYSILRLWYLIVDVQNTLRLGFLLQPWHAIDKLLTSLLKLYEQVSAFLPQHQQVLSFFA